MFALSALPAKIASIGLKTGLQHYNTIIPGRPVTSITCITTWGEYTHSHASWVT